MLLPKCYTNTLCKSNSKGEKLLCAHGRVRQTQLPFWRRISQSEIRKIAAAKKEAAKARAGKNSFPPTPFLFARPSVPLWFCRAKLGNQSGFCSKWVLTFSNKHHQRRFVARRAAIPPSVSARLAAEQNRKIFLTFFNRTSPQIIFN